MFDQPNIVSFVAWLVANGLALVVTLNKIPQWTALPGNVKGIAVFVFLVVILPVGGDLLRVWLESLPTDVLAQVNHYFNLIVAGWYTWGASQYGFEGYKALRAAAP